MSPEEGVARAVRALVDVGDSFVLLARERVRSDPERFERRVIQPLRELFERGQAAGDIRPDIASALLTESLIGLIVGVLASTPPPGKEDIIATITDPSLQRGDWRGAESTTSTSAIRARVTASGGWPP